MKKKCEIKRKPWFLKRRKLGDWSYLRRKDFNELLEIINEAVDQAVRQYSPRNWERIKDAIVFTLYDLAKKHHCTARLKDQGGHICIYHHGKPIFVFRIGTYARRPVEDLLKSKALYRGIIDIVHTESEELKVLYYMLPTTTAGKWKRKEAIDMLDIIECVKEDPGCTIRGMQAILKMSPNKIVQLLHLLVKRQIVHRRGKSVASGWYLSHEEK